jgi:transcriptional regulator with XRE-family HTH domain
MVRPLLSPAERERGRRLGAALKQARGLRSMTDVAAASGVPIETLRKIEAGRVPTPAFFTVVALSSALDIDLATLIANCADEARHRSSLAG